MRRQASGQRGRERIYVMHTSQPAKLPLSVAVAVTARFIMLLATELRL